MKQNATYTSRWTIWNFRRNRHEIKQMDDFGNLVAYNAGYFYVTGEH